MAGSDNGWIVAEVGMSNSVDEFFEHHGIKGMKWGVHRTDAEIAADRAAKADAKASKKVAKSQKKWEKNAASDKTFMAVYNDAAEKMNTYEIGRINSKPAYRDADLTHDSPLRRKYYKEVEDTFAKQMDQAAQKHIGVSPDGSKRVRFKSTDGGEPRLQWEDVKHSAMYPEFEIEVDDNGHILKIKVKSDSEISHYGIKGMKWGVHRTDAQIEAASEDAAAAKATAESVKSNHGSVAHLSNKELQNLLDRMNLEQRYSKIQDENSKSAKGEKKIKKILGYAKTAQEVYSIVNGPIAKDIRKALANK